MKLLNVLPFKAGDKVVQVPVRRGHNRHYWVTSCKYGDEKYWGSNNPIVSLALSPTDEAFGTYPCDWFRKVTDETT